MIRYALAGISFVVEFALIAVGVVVVLTANSVGALLLWDALAVVYLGVRLAWLYHDRWAVGDSELRVVARDPTARFLAQVFTVLCSVIGVTAGIAISVRPEEGAVPTQVAAVPAVLLAWTLLHFAYAERYRESYVDALPERVLDFPGTPSPRFADFVYFSFTIGTSFAVSDVTIRDTRVRLAAVIHAVLGFFYNVAVLGIAVRYLTEG